MDNPIYWYHHHPGYARYRNWWLKYAFKGLTLMDIVTKYMMGYSKNPTTRLYY